MLCIIYKMCDITYSKFEKIFTVGLASVLIELSWEVGGGTFSVILQMGRTLAT